MSTFIVVVVVTVANGVVTLFKWVIADADVNDVAFKKILLLFC